jgi:predicted DNA-binding transcriptional regulator AlpA
MKDDHSRCPHCGALPRLVGPREVCKALGVSASTLWRWIHVQRKFPEPVRLTRLKVAWREADVRAWIDAQFSHPPERGA